jgi:hypothetical protein
MRRLPLLLVLIAMLPAGYAHAATDTLWATINVCDTAAAPDAMGVRASMPGNGTGERMYMRFQAWWYSRYVADWFPVRGQGRSPWLYVGRARHRAHQGGWTFNFGPPESGEFVVRGKVQFQWRKRVRRGRGKGFRWKVVERRHATTRSGIQGVGGGDPPGRSDGLCAIR